MKQLGMEHILLASAVFFLIMLSLFLHNQQSKQQTGCTMEAKICPDGTTVGRTGPNCEFDPCPTDNLTRHECTSESRNGDVCIQVYQPVCGWFNSSIQCFAYPCASTASNSCVACSNPGVEYWTDGECPTASQIANPASTNCIDQGGTLEILNNSLGMCTLANGTVCEEWSLLRGECGQ